MEEGGFEPPKLTQQIYSLPPLATRELLHIQLLLQKGVWSWWTDSNPRPVDYKSTALPTELHQHISSSTTLLSLTDRRLFVKDFFQKICLNRRGPALRPLRDLQRVWPSGWCPRCGGELYGDEGPLCPACQEESKQEEEAE